MNKYSVFLSCLIVASLTACKKSDNRQYSTWHILGKGDFSTNKVIVNNFPQSYKIELLTEDLSNTGFGITFIKYSDLHLPQSGDYKLTTGTQTISEFNKYIFIGFLYNNVSYTVGANNSKTITAQSYNAKAKYVLDTTWFYNSTNLNDSVQIYGTFLEP